MRPLALLLIFTIAAPAPAQAQVRRSIGKTSASGVTLRKRTNVNPLIAGAGTAELDWAGLYSFRQASWSVPAALRVTPAQTGFWSRTELGLASDTHTLSLTGTHVLVEREHFDIAVAPQTTFFVRDGSGVRLGALAVVRYDHRDHTVSATLNWTAATRASGGNPEHLADFGLGYGWKRGRWSPHVNFVREVATANAPTSSLFEGVEYDLTGRISLDVTAQHVTLGRGATDHQILVGLNIAGLRLRR